MSYARSALIVFVSLLLGACNNGGFTADPTPNSVLTKCSESSDCIALEWDAPETNPELEYEIVGYRLYYGTNTPPLGKNLDVGLVTSVELRGLTPGYYFFSIYARYKAKGSNVILLSTRSEAIHSSSPPDNAPTPPSKPENGETTVPANEVHLPAEALQIGSSSNSALNTFTTDLTAAITLVTKAYTFTTPKTGKNTYTLESIKYDTSKCQTRVIDAHVFLFEEKGATQEITMNQVHTLKPDTRYRIQLYMDHVSCKKLSGDFVFKNN